MSNHTQQILEAAKFNQKLAIEMYCELYIYNNYTEDQIGSDCRSFSYKEEITPIECKGNTWLGNLMYRLNSIFRRRGIDIRIDIEETEELVENSDKLMLLSI